MKAPKTPLHEDLEGRAGGACMNHLRCSFRFLSYKDL